MIASLLGLGLGWLAYRMGRWWIAAVPLALSAIAAVVIFATGRPIGMTPVPFVVPLAVGALLGLYARQWRDMRSTP